MTLERWILPPPSPSTIFASPFDIRPPSLRLGVCNEQYNAMSRVIVKPPHTNVLSPAQSGIVSHHLNPPSPRD